MSDPVRPSRDGTVSVGRGGASSRSRHGRGIRSSVTGPYLPVLQTREESFDAVVVATAEYLRDLWQEELQNVSFEVAGIPRAASDAGVARWLALPAERRVILYRVPIERFARAHRIDALQRRMLVESCVFKAVAELLGKEPWELAPERYRHF